MLDKIESGDTTIRLKEKKVYTSKKSNDNSEKTIENYGLKMER